jgi:dipeptidase D
MEYARSVARERDLKVVQDGVGNLVVWRAGSGTGSSEPVIVHAHLDMACARKDGPDSRIPGQVDIQEDGWLVSSGANKTSLGADNGIGVAIALALLEESVDSQLPPLEVLFTVQHEEGFLGAWGLNATCLRVANSSISMPKITGI